MKKRQRNSANILRLSAAGGVWLFLCLELFAGLALLGQAGFSLIPDAVYETNGDVRSIRVPVTECSNVTATPIVVGNWLVYPMHDFGFNCENLGPYRLTLMGYNFEDSLLYDLSPLRATGEATLLYRPDRGLVYWNVTKAQGFATVLVLDDVSFSLQQRINAGMTSDASGTFLGELYYFGTVNVPDEPCQDPINPNCGAVFACDEDGNIVLQLNTDDGFRSWVGAGITTDGEYLYVGGSPETKGSGEYEYLYGCTVIKLDRDLNIVATFDPGEQGCYRVPYPGLNADAVGGEIVPDGSGLWVQYVRPNDAGMKSVLYRLDLDLQEQSRVEFDFRLDLQTAAFYAAPTIDKDGNVYAPITLPEGESGMQAVLYKVTIAGDTTRLAGISGSYAYASPTLADDRYVLFATDGRLDIYTIDGTLVRTDTLGTEARVLASPVLHGGLIYVLQEDGTLNIIANSGLSGYGEAIWPRYRRDNHGSGVLPDSITTSVAAAKTRMPAVFNLEQNHPNPFSAQGDPTRSPETAIRFTLSVADDVELRIYDIRGRLVRTLVRGIRNAGAHTVHWDGRDARGQALPAGIYLYRLRVGEAEQVRSMMLMR